MRSTCHPATRHAAAIHDCGSIAAAGGEVAFGFFEGFGRQLYNHRFLRLEVVEDRSRGDTNLAGDHPGRPDCLQDGIGGREVGERALHHTAAPVRPEQMYVPDTESCRQTNQVIEIADVVLEDRGGQRRPETGVDRRRETSNDRSEAPAATDRVVDLSR